MFGELTPRISPYFALLAPEHIDGGRYGQGDRPANASQRCHFRGREVAPTSEKCGGLAAGRAGQSSVKSSLTTRFFEPDLKIKDL